MYFHTARWLILLAVALAPLSAQAESGVFELNDARAQAGDPTTLPADPPGYPIVISRPGSYRLTGDLNVPAGVNGIELDADGVRIDLNGFAVRGPGSCFPGACSASGSASGIIHGFGGGGFQATIRNGTVSGFGGSCIQLRDGARVDDVRVFMCGERGINLRSLFGDPSAAFGNRVENTGQSGLVLEGGGLYRDNIVLRSGLAGASPSIVGGTASGGNFCDDGRCSRRGIRRYYLTPLPKNGSQATTACVAGYHMASRWELADPSSLEYDSVNGQSNADAGTGPPEAPSVGWARMGTTSNPMQVGYSNCSNWSTTSGNGTVLVLAPDWGLSAGLQHGPWNIGSHACSNLNPVWCIED